MNAPLKFELTAAEHGELAESLMPLYERQGEVFRLNVDGLDDEAVGRALRAERDGRKADKRQANEQVDAVRAELEAERKANEGLRTKAFESFVRNAATTHGLHAGAHADCLRAAKELFELSADGSMQGRDGKTTFDAWMASTRTSCAHWYPASGSGSGAQQSRPGSMTESASVRRSTFDAMSPAKKAAVIASGTRIIDTH